MTLAYVSYSATNLTNSSTVAQLPRTPIPFKLRRTLNSGSIQSSVGFHSFYIVSYSKSLAACVDKCKCPGYQDAVESCCIPVVHAYCRSTTWLSTAIWLQSCNSIHWFGQPATSKYPNWHLFRSVFSFRLSALCSRWMVKFLCFCFLIQVFSHMQSLFYKFWRMAAFKCHPCLFPYHLHIT